MNDLKVYEIFEDLFYSKQIGKEEESLQNYLMQFAKQNGLSFSFDQNSNVIITNGDGDKVTLLVCLNFCTMRPKKKWFDMCFWRKKLARSGDYILSNFAPLCAESLGGLAIALHALKSFKNVQAVFVFDKENLNYKFFEGKMLGSSKIIQLVAGKKDDICTSAPFGYSCLAKCSNEKLFLKNSLDLKTFKLTIFENEKGGDNLNIKLLTEFLEKIGDAKINRFYSGFFPQNEYKNEVIFTTFMSLFEVKRLIKTFYEEKKKIYPTLALRCTRQINQTLVLSTNQLAKIASNFKSKGGELGENAFNSYISCVNSNSGFVNFKIVSNDLKTIKSQFESIKNDLKTQNIDCVCYEEMQNFCAKDFVLARDMAEANLSLVRGNSSFSEPTPLGKILSSNKKTDAVMLTFTVENLGLADEKLKFSSLLNTSLFLENFLARLQK